ELFRGHVTTIDRHHEAVVDAGHVQGRRARLRPEHLAGLEVQAMQIVRLQRGGDYATIFDQQRRIGPAIALAELSHAAVVRLGHRVLFARVLVGPEQWPPGNIHGDDAARRRRTNDDPAYDHRRSAGHAAEWILIDVVFDIPQLLQPYQPAGRLI